MLQVKHEGWGEASYRGGPPVINSRPSKFIVDKGDPIVAVVGGADSVIRWLQFVTKKSAYSFFIRALCSKPNSLALQKQAQCMGLLASARRFSSLALS